MARILFTNLLICAGFCFLPEELIAEKYHYLISTITQINKINRAAETTSITKKIAHNYRGFSYYEIIIIIALTIITLLFLFY